MIMIIKRILSSIIVAALLLGAAGCMPKDHRYVEGLYLKSAHSQDMIIIDDYGPCVMTADSDKVSFDDVTDGDRIKIEVAQIAESYPMQAVIYSLKKLSDGEVGDIDSDTLAKLAEMG